MVAPVFGWWTITQPNASSKNVTFYNEQNNTSNYLLILWIIYHFFKMLFNNYCEFFFCFFTSIFCTKPSIWPSIWASTEFMAVAAIANYDARVPTQLARLTFVYYIVRRNVNWLHMWVYVIRIHAHTNERRRSVAHSMSTLHWDTHIYLFLSLIRNFVQSHSHTRLLM